MQKNRSFIRGAVILGIAGLIIKILGAAFRIPLTNIIGDSGMGYYQTAYPIYVLFLTIATAGIPTAISRMVAERNAIDQRYEAHRVFKLSFMLLLGIGAFSSSILFFGAESITRFIKEPEAVYAMKAIAPALFFVPLMASFRGYFQGLENMTPTATSQIIEQFFRVLIGLGLAVYLLPKGLQYAAAGASFGATAGGIFGFIGILIIYAFNKKAIASSLENADKAPKESAKRILWALLLIAVPITIGASIMPIINTIDAAIVKIRLVSIGYDSDVARSLYGQLTGMAAPLINFPQVLTQAVAMSLVPVVASSHRRDDLDFMKKNIALGLRYAFVLSVPCAVGMIVLSKPIMLLLYPLQPQSAVNAASCLAILAMGIVFLATVQTLTGVLQGIGKQAIPVRNLFVGALVKIVITYVLTGIPSINVRGAAFGTVMAYFVASLLNLLSVKKYTNATIDFNLTFLKPLVSALVMGIAVTISYHAMPLSVGNSLSTVFSISIGAVVYVCMIFITKSISVEELETFPRTEKLVKMLKKVKGRR
ncbi:MAG: polysaccharide biosynthesis protein [Clostridia bacterium]|nr:polysaccharide biosynthesis protein [Clostridia bacterium]